MTADTALARARAAKCELCAKGIPVTLGRYHVVHHQHATMRTTYACTVPSDADLYEELARERDALKARWNFLEAQVINVRAPFLHGWRNLFWYSPPFDEEGEPDGSKTLAQYVDEFREKEKTT